MVLIDVGVLVDANIITTVIDLYYNIQFILLLLLLSDLTNAYITNKLN